MAKSTFSNITEYSAQSLSTLAVPIVKADDTVKHIEELLKTDVKSYKSISNIFVVDSQQKFLGSFPISRLYSENSSTTSQEIIQGKKQITVRPHTRTHHLALTVIDNNLTAIAVVDESEKFLGAVVSQEIFKILDNQALEHSLKLGGISKKHRQNLLSIPISTSLKHRLPWLILGLMGGIVTAGLVRGFEETLERNIVLAAFIPLVSYMADAVGTQMEAFIIRDLAVDPKLDFRKYFIKQFKIIFMIAILISIVLYLVSSFLFHDSSLSVVVSLGLLIAVISSVLTGMLIPYYFSKFKFDPADASGPIATIMQNILSLLIYFSIATIIL